MGYERDLLKGLGIFCYNTYIYLGEPILILSLNPLSQVRYWNILRCKIRCPLSVNLLMIPHKTKYRLLNSVYRERSGSVVECLTRDRGAAGSSLTGVTAFGPWERRIYPSLVLDPSLLTERLLMGCKESNQNKKNLSTCLVAHTVLGVFFRTLTVYVLWWQQRF